MTLPGHRHTHFVVAQPDALCLRLATEEEAVAAAEAVAAGTITRTRVYELPEGYLEHPAARLVGHWYHGVRLPPDEAGAADYERVIGAAALRAHALLTADPEALGLREREIDATFAEDWAGELAPVAARTAADAAFPDMRRATLRGAYGTAFGAAVRDLIVRVRWYAVRDLPGDPDDGVLMVVADAGSWESRLEAEGAAELLRARGHAVRVEGSLALRF